MSCCAGVSDQYAATLDSSPAPHTMKLAACPIQAFLFRLRLLRWTADVTGQSISTVLLAANNLFLSARTDAAIALSASLNLTW